MFSQLRIGDMQVRVPLVCGSIVSSGARLGFGLGLGFMAGEKSVGGPVFDLLTGATLRLVP
jgi:hypothetical protein